MILGTWWDGDTWPVARMALKDSGIAKNSTDLAVEFFIRDGSTLIARRPGVMVSPKSSGLIDLYLRGIETNWDGAGKELTVYPKLYIPVVRLFTGGKWETQQAVNLLTNPSFDTASGSNPSRIATGWSVIGGQTSEIFDNYSNDTIPEVIGGGGSFQLVNPGGTSVSSLEQQVSQSVAAGDYVSAGVWVRATGLVSAANSNWALRLLTSGGVDNTTMQFEGGAAGGLGYGFDWRFVTVEKKMLVAHTTLTHRLEYKGELNASIRFDEANLFVGRYLVKKLEPLKIVVRSRRRVPKTLNQIQAIGSFEQDSNNDGIADGWIHDGTFTGVTATMERDPSNIRTGDGAQKLVMVNSSSAARILHQRRGNHKAGETWQFGAWFKTSGTMSAAASIQLLTDTFDGQRVQSSSVAVGPTLGAFTKVVCSVTLLADTSLIECRINVSSITSGTLWIDDAELEKI